MGASVSTVENRSKRIVYRARIRTKGYPHFSITFDDKEEAFNWLDKNEDEYYKNPRRYFIWRKNVYRQMRKGDAPNPVHMILGKLRL